MVTVAELLTADPEPFHRAALAWSALAGDLDRAYEEYVRGVHRVDVGWALGEGADAAAQKLKAQAHELSNAHGPARRIADALVRHAFGIGEIRVHVERIIARAEVVNEDATTRDLAELLRRAQRLDAETTAAIRANQPTAGRGLGTAATPAIERDEVARQRGRSPDDVHAWWQGLSPEQQEQVLRDHPDLVGWLNGVPASDRDRANRSILDSQLATLSAREVDLAGQLEPLRRTALTTLPNGVDAALLIDVLQRQLTVLRATAAGLQVVHDQLAIYGDRAMLLGIDGDGRAVISLGDPDLARHTAVFVPGINTDLVDIGGDLYRVDSLRREADRITPVHHDVAVVYWLGYDTPGVVGAMGDRAARDGARDFTTFVDGLRATNQQGVGPNHVTAIGHSYGSTVVAEAALAGGLNVDDIIAAGSPGMHTDRAANLNLDPRHVWGGLAEGDLIGGGLGDLNFVHGEEPTDAAFGGNRFEVDTRGHSGYWTENSASLRNQAFIVVGQYDRVGYYYGSPPSS